MANGSSPRRRVMLVLAAALLVNLLAGGAILFGVAGAVGIGVCSIAYLLGVRHAFDADHIAAIDNVTRRLRARGERPAAVGLFFSLGHSTVVFGLTAAAIVAAHSVSAALPVLDTWGGLIGNIVSAAFLTAIGVANLRLLAGMLRRRGLDGGIGQPTGLGRLTHHAGSSWKMFPLGMLFGLGFDTASEVALLALSIAAAHEAHAQLWSAMLLPLMFTAGMALMDTLESLLMLRLYDWAIADRDRTLRLNTAVTATSVCLALGVAANQWVGLAARPAGIASLWRGLDSSMVGLLATMLLLGLGALAWLVRQRAVALRSQTG